MGNIEISQTNELPIGLDILMSVSHKQHTLTLDQLTSARYVYPMTPSDLGNELKRLTTGNDFRNGRYPYLPIIQAVFREAFEKYWPETEDVSFLEVGPGPFAYSATRELIPSDKISDINMLEASPHYCASINRIGNGNPWNVICGDIHSPPKEVQTYDVIYCQSSLDSTPFLELALQNLNKMLNPGGRIFIFQDVFPDTNAILGIEYHQRNKDKRNEKTGESIDFGIGDLGPILWLTSESPWVDNPGQRITSSEYWSRAFSHFAERSGFQIMNEGRIWKGTAILPYPQQDRQIICDKLGGFNSIERYHADVTRNHRDIPANHYMATYATDLLVLEKI